MPKKTAHELLEELEGQFQSVHEKIVKRKDSYLANHEKDYTRAKTSYNRQKANLAAATKRVTKDAEKLRKNGTQAAQNQLKKTKAAALLLSQALSEAKDIMSTARDQLSTAKPFKKKLAARAKALAAFEKEWEKKQKEEEKAKLERAKKRKKDALQKKVK